MAEDPNSRIVLLNHLVSRSKTRNRGDEEPPTISGHDLLSMIYDRYQKGLAIEYQGEESEPDEAKRIALNTGKNYTRLAHMLMLAANEGEDRYAVMLFEFWDANRRSFHVADPSTFEGRSLEGSGNERGIISAAAMIKLPASGRYDEGKYRCAIESVPSLSRSVIEYFLCRQIRRETDRDEWTYEVERPKPNGKRIKKSLRYTPRLELQSEGIGRKIGNGGSGTPILKNILFTKRQSRENTGGATEIRHTEFTADLRVYISAAQGPKQPGALKQWVDRLRRYYEDRGYTTKLAFRSAEGDIAAGEVHPALSGATDLLLCKRQSVAFACPREIWEETLRQDVVDCLRDVLDRDELWECPE